MTGFWTWLAAIATVGAMVLYECFVVAAQARNPQRLARAAHATLREDWFAAVSAHEGSELLAVQTLRNSLMSATMTASTAVLGLMGAVTLAAPSLHETFGEAAAGWPMFTPRLALELVLIALLFASLVASVMSVRYYHHLGFISAMPVGSESRKRWSEAGIAYVRRAGTLYSWALRYLVMVTPILACILHPLAGPLAALLVVGVLFAFDRMGSDTARR